MIYVSLLIVAACAYLNKKACSWYRESAAKIARVKAEIARIEYENEIFR